jgi:hypothetical protein
MYLTLLDVQKAWQLKDPNLIDYILHLSQQEDSEPENPIRDEALTFGRFIQTIFSYQFREKSPEEQKSYRIETLKRLEADDAEVPLAERLKLHDFLLSLWRDQSPYARTLLQEIIQLIPLRYGAWRALKTIFKEAEANNDYPMLAEIAVRCDIAQNFECEFSSATLVYLRRRAWRYLRQLGQSLPSVYPDAAVSFLSAYPDNTQWDRTWVANHIFYHDSKRYSSSSFGYIRQRGELLKNRAFSETWTRSPEPLLRLLSQARSETSRQFACDALKQDFEVFLRNVEPQWIMQLAALPIQSQHIDSFVVWLLKNASQLEQHQFRQLGLHDTVITLLDSSSSTAQQYAVSYIKAHARDLPLETLLRQAFKNEKTIGTLVQQLLTERDPRKDVSLDAWGTLLQSRMHYKFAASVLHKHFGRKELTPEWFSTLLLSGTENSVQFCEAYLLDLHPIKTLGISYFQNLLDELTNSQSDNLYQAINFAAEQLDKLDVNELTPEFLQRALLNPHLQYITLNYFNSETIKASVLPLDYYKALAYEPDWSQHALIKSIKQSDTPWAKHLSFDENLAETIREWLSDVRQFSPVDIGFEWLMQLVNRSEEEYHNFAIGLMTKAFIPADFASNIASNSAEAAEPEPAASDEKNIDKSIDLEQQSFMFTGKLKTMTRKEAHSIVTDGNGKISSGVTAKLDFLVIGDEGSPMYGNGRKGSKQVKAEGLNNDKDAGIIIISETAFLQKMAGEEREVSADAVQEGCENLWAMATEKPDSPISKFAIQYFRHHHPEICLKLTDRPVDPGAEIPDEFATFERFAPLFQNAHSPLRSLAMDYAHYEFARWAPDSQALSTLCESKYNEVREFVTDSLLEETTAENKRYSIDASLLEPQVVFHFCEAKNNETRQLGMQIIKKYEAFQKPEALFQLSESPDRALRAFVIRILWSLYRRYSTTAHWKPALPVMSSMGKQNQEKLQEKQENLGTGLPQRPKDLPSDTETLRALLNRWLYELPPGRLSKGASGQTLKPLAANVAKCALIDTLRDVAIDDAEFAQVIYPLLNDFTRSRGKMEQSACLVAVTRLQHAHSDLLGAHA